MTFAGEVQVGWTVWSSDGENLGTIVSIDPQTISVKQGGLLGGKLDIPRTAVEDVGDRPGRALDDEAGAQVGLVAPRRPCEDWRRRGRR